MKKKAKKGQHAWAVKVGEKGQIVIPKEARSIFGIEPGDTLLLLGDEDRGLAIPPLSALNRLAASLFVESPSETEEDE